MPPHSWSRRVLGTATAATAVGVLLAAMSTASAAPAAGVTKTVRWGSVTVQVPKAWPVYDLRRDPSRCVRFDVHAVYLGTGAGSARCPARALGKTEALQLEAAGPAARAKAGLATRATRLGGTPAIESRGREVVVELRTLGVVATASYGADDRIARGVLGTLRASGAPGVAAPAASPRAASPSHAPAAAPTGPYAAATISPGTYTGLGFDACTAPSTSTMTAWLASPYRSVGIYIGGSNRACGDGYLSVSWVSAVIGQGWKLAPLYVGDQAPCVGQAGLAEFSTDPKTAAGQGANSARDAVTHARVFGLPDGSPIYYDLEGYSADTVCREAVYAFLDAWTVELHRRGYRSAVYSSSSSGISDLGKATSRPGFHLPDGIWLANWNGVQGVFGDPYISDAYWSGHRRLHQYAGGHDETYGGVTINIDSDYDDGLVVTGSGSSFGVDYGPGTYGPDGAAFSSTGSWSSGAPAGYRSQMLWTYSSGSPATASATWAPSLAPGQYDVSAYVPDDHAGGQAHYTVTGATTSLKVIDQGAYSNAFVPLGRFSTDAHGRLSVRLTNDGDPPRAHTIGADAMRFTYLPPAGAGGTAWRPPADFTGDGRADIAVWRPGNGYWYRYGAAPVQWGTAGDVPVAADYTGDHSADLAVWRPGNGYWYRYGAAPVQWGTAGDVPVVADFTGDGRADIAVWRPSDGGWYVRGQPTLRYGTAGDVPVPANLVGDRRGDTAVWRPSNGRWYIRNSPAVRYGTAGDVPVPARFGARAGVAVWRPANGGWYVPGRPTTPYGTRGDVPV